MIACLMVENQRRMILESIPTNGAMLEWGSGGTSVWIADRMGPSRRLVSVEHHEQWAAKVREANALHRNYAMRFVPPSVPEEEGANATAFEENPSPFDAYINQPDIGDYDVILVDGVARGACLMKVFEVGKSGATVFLHDANRRWYDWALRSLRIVNPFVLDGGMMIRRPLKAPDLWVCTLC